MLTKHTVIAAAALLMSACASNNVFQRNDVEWIAAQPDTYFQQLGVTRMTRMEYREWSNRRAERLRELDRRDACILGSRPAIDRSKLNCENVEGSPEHKALLGEPLGN